jgi:hypothetical protein
MLEESPQIPGTECIIPQMVTRSPEKELVNRQIVHPTPPPLPFVGLHKVHQVEVLKGIPVNNTLS